MPWVRAGMTMGECGVCVRSSVHVCVVPVIGVQLRVCTQQHDVHSGKGRNPPHGDFDRGWWRRGLREGRRREGR